MEETIGYEALFSPEEWDSLTDWDEPEPPDKGHHISVWAPEPASDDSRWDLECDHCGHLGNARDKQEALVLARLHVDLIAIVVDRWETSLEEVQPQ